MTTTSSGLRKAATGAREIWDRRVVVKIKHILETIVVLFVVFGLITWQVGTLLESSRQGDLRDARGEVYQAQLNTYQISLNQYEACQAQIEQRLIDRERFTASNLTLRAVVDAFGADSTDPAFATVYSILDRELEAIINTLPILGRDICPEIPVQPTRPDEGDN